MANVHAIRIEGGLLGPDIIEQALRGELAGQKPADFGLPAQRRLTDEIAAIYSDARAQWLIFNSRLERLPDDDIATTVTRDAWMLPFLSTLGYELVRNQKGYEEGGVTYAISHQAGSDEHAPPVHIVGAKQDLGKVAASGRPRLAPHSLVQEYLNRSETLWGLVTNGFELRLLRDCTNVKRQAYVSFDLRAIFEEGRFNDFAVLYRLLHRSRLPRGGEDADQCLLEQYYQHSVEQGGRVREKLRVGVEECLKRLANGFLSHPGSQQLRKRLTPNESGVSQTEATSLHRQLLILVYRLLFLLVSEDRGLVSDKDIYRKHYGIDRLRKTVDRRSAYTEHDDLWQSLRVLWNALTKADLAALLGVAPLNGDLFAPQDLDSASISNRDLLYALKDLVYYEEKAGSPLRKVNYGALDVEELGSVYESLLELHPVLTFLGNGAIEFDYSHGSERKTTGSYYTPPSLVAELIKSALEPVIADRLAEKPSDKERALLGIRVIDPACGSGHFLLAAARTIGRQLAKVRTGEDEPVPEVERAAVRDVIAHCIYGVDRNPLAVDLCRVALWIESHSGDKPLTFLDHRIRCGDALVGVFDLETLLDGIPDKAFEALEGDEKDVARQARADNAAQRKSQQLTLFTANLEGKLRELSAASKAVDAIDDDTPEHVGEKKKRFADWQRSDLRQPLHLACDLWTAAFFQPYVRPMTDGVYERKGAEITTNAVNEVLAGAKVDERLQLLAVDLSNENRFFHWPLEFPEVFERGGFDVVLGNPPWERIKLQEMEFFSVRDPEIALSANKAERAKLIKTLPTRNPKLHREYIRALRSASATSVLFRAGGRFPLTGRGDINTYAVFAEHDRNLLGPRGRAGVIVPSGIATDDTTKFFFGDLVQTSSLASLYDFENRKKIFAEIDSRIKFCLVTMRGPALGGVGAEFVFFALDTDELRDLDKRFSLTAAEISLLNPNTGNCPIFRSQKDAELTKAIYRRVPILWREPDASPSRSEGDLHPDEGGVLRGSNTPENAGHTEMTPPQRALVPRGEDPPHSVRGSQPNPWRLSFNRMFDMSNDSHHFRNQEWLEGQGYRREGNVWVGTYDRYLPLYEAKMLHQFDHRWATYVDFENSELVSREEKENPHFVVQPRYWVREEIVESAIPKFPEPVAKALALGDEEGLRAILLAWAAAALVEEQDARVGILSLHAGNLSGGPRDHPGVQGTISATTEVLASVSGPNPSAPGDVSDAPGIPPGGLEPLATGLGHLPGVPGDLPNMYGKDPATRLEFPDAAGASPDARLLLVEAQSRLTAPIAKLLGGLPLATFGRDLQADYPLSPEDAAAIGSGEESAEVWAERLLDRFSPKWLMAFRRVARTTDVRSAIFSALPKMAVGDSTFLMQLEFHEPRLHASLLAALNSFAFDFMVRQKVGGMNFSFFLVKQLPVPTPSALSVPVSFASGRPLADWLLPRVLELAYTATDLEPLARQCGYDGPPFPWDPERRLQLRCEIDAAFFHLYLSESGWRVAGSGGETGGGERVAGSGWGLSPGETPEQLAALTAHFPTPRDAVAYILDQFPIVRAADEKEYGTYRTKDRILEVYDAMAAGQFVSPLFPHHGVFV